MQWVLQKGFRDIEPFSEILERWNIPYNFVNVVPFVGELIPEPEFDTKNVVCWGSYSMRHAAKRYGWSPGVFDIEKVSFEIQREHWGECMLNYDSEICLFQNINISKPSFIRPVDDSKSIAGAVMTPEEFHEWQPKAISSLNNHLFQVSTVKEIWSEYRFWVVHGRVITCCMYKLGNTVLYHTSVPDGPIELVNSLIGKTYNRLDPWLPAEAFVIDICETPFGYKVVEINTINSSGLYAADVQALLLTIDREF